MAFNRAVMSDSDEIDSGIDSDEERRRRLTAPIFRPFESPRMFLPFDDAPMFQNSKSPFSKIVIKRVFLEPTRPPMYKNHFAEEHFEKAFAEPQRQPLYKNPFAQEHFEKAFAEPQRQPLPGHDPSECPYRQEKNACGVNGCTEHKEPIVEVEEVADPEPEDDEDLMELFDPVPTMLHTKKEKKSLLATLSEMFILCECSSDASK